MCHGNYEKQKKTVKERIDLSNEEKIRSLARKETYKYFEMLEADIIK